jgi:ComF family protein
MDRLISIWEYKAVVRKAILGLKYKYATDVSKELSDYLVNYLVKTDLNKRFLLVPTPLHKLRRNWRGFNQAEEIGKLVSDKMGWMFQSDIIFRTKNKTPQVQLTKEDRKKNVRGIFSFNHKYNLQNITHNIILFDDVYTTGSTMKEAAKVLKRNKAKIVWGMTVAK